MNTALLAVAMFALLPSALFAQREVPATDFVQPGPKDIVLAGNEQTHDVACADGNSVYVEGQHNEVQVHGACRFVRIQGNRNFVWVDRMTTVPVEGNDNTVFVSDVRTQYSSRGNGNRFEKSKH